MTNKVVFFIGEARLDKSDATGLGTRTHQICGGQRRTVQFATDLRYIIAATAQRHNVRITLGFVLRMCVLETALKRIITPYAL